MVHQQYIKVVESTLETLNKYRRQKKSEIAASPLMLFNKALPKSYFIGLNNILPPLLSNFLNMTTPDTSFIFSCLSPPSSGPPVWSQPSLDSVHISLNHFSHHSLPFSSPLPAAPLSLSSSLPISALCKCCNRFTSSRTVCHRFSRMLRKLTTYMISVQERGQPVGPGAGEVQPGE